jgi:hypothetical protein
MSMKVVVVMCMSALCGCAAMVREARAPALERLGERGVSSPMLLVEAGDVLRFVNADVRPHQIYSNDCGELSSRLLVPGEIFSAEIGSGPKVCHFQDLLTPFAAGYSGTLQVHDAEGERRLETAD